MKEVMIGNFAIARGLVEAGVELAASYPGTPSSEILPGIIEFNRREKLSIHAEWSVNERCAFETAFGAAFSGKKAACIMKQVGLNVAFSPLLRGRSKHIEGAFVIVACDDPGPQSSQTEQDTRLLATMFGITVFDPVSPQEAADLAYYAIQYSIEHHVPVILRSTHRVSHAREAIDLFPPGERRVVLTEGPMLNNGAGFGIVASGMSYSVASDVVYDLGLEKEVSLCKALKVFPLSPEIRVFVAAMEKVLVLEETDSTLEALLDGGDKVLGRISGHVPSEGELNYDVVRGVIGKIAEACGIRSRQFVPDPSVDNALKNLTIPPRPPKLCAGCPHRASFYAMRHAFPEALFPGDIGCYTLGTYQGAVDTCLDMGSGVTLAAGFYDSLNQDGEGRPVIASVGDSTFFHACLEPLYDAVRKHKQFLLIIMDNGTTAMTGMQPTPQSGVRADGAVGKAMPIENVVRGLGVEFLQIVDPYDLHGMIGAVRDAYEYFETKGETPAVIIARRPCILLEKRTGDLISSPVPLEENCVGCKRCLTLFDCPAFFFHESSKKIKIDEGLCTKCGVCLLACALSRPRKGQGQAQKGRTGPQTV